MVSNYTIGRLPFNWHHFTTPILVPRCMEPWYSNMQQIRVYMVAMSVIIPQLTFGDAYWE